MKEPMHLSPAEFRGMNNPIRRCLQRNIEFPTFKSMGLNCRGKDVLEIGCGSGYGAILLNSQNPKSYVGVDVMPQQIALAQKIGLPNTEFSLQDATDLSRFPSGSIDTVVIFGVLHHIPPWRQVLKECYRVLHSDGYFYGEEPEGRAVAGWDRVFKWGHPGEDRLTLQDLEDHLKKVGFQIINKKHKFHFSYYAAKKQV